MSKFFASGESDEDIESEEEEEEEEETRETMGGIAQNNRPTLVYSESESDSEDEKRVVRSVRDKRFDAILTPISQLKNHLKINDWVAISKDWDTIQKALEKAHILIAKEGIPPAFLGLLLFLEKKLKDLNDNKEAVKKLNGLNSKSYNTMKQKVKKELIKYAAKLEEYKKSPAATEETDDGNTEKKTEKKSEKKSPAKAKKTKDDEEDDDDEEEEEESEDEESDDEDDKKKAKKSVKKEESEEDEDEDEESEEEESDDDKKKKKPAASKKKSGKKSESEEEDDDDDEDDEEDEDEDESEEDESESSDEDEDLSLTSADKKSAYFTREFWVKKASTIEKERKKKEEEDKKRARKPQRGGDSDEESEESGDDDDEDDEEESDRDHSEDEDIKRRKAREAKKKKEKKQRAEAEEKGEGKKEEKKEDVTPEAVLRKLRELLGQRGKRKTDRMALITHLRLLKARAEEAIIIAAKSGTKNAETTATASTGASLSAGTDAKQSEVELTPAAVLKISTTLVSCYFDISLNKTEAPYIPIPLWREAYSAVNDVLDQLEKTRLIRLSEDDKVDETFDEQLNEQLAIVGVANTNNNVPATPAPVVAEKKDKKNEVQFVHGSIISFVKLLHGEFRKSLLYIDHHSSEYVDRLRDEWKLVDLLQRAQSYYQRLNKPLLQAKCALAHLDLVHYHYTPAQDAVRNQLLSEQKQKEAADNTPAKANLPDASSEKIRSLASFIYHHGDDKSKVRAVLYEVYHLSMHNRWEDARDRFLSSHITDSAHALDVKTQILFNRVQAQLGLCAFRIGEYRRALHCLHDLFPAQINSPNAKELLAQGVAARFNQEQLSADELASLKRRMLPFHQHINIDTLEAVHLICAMIFEVPNMARFGSGNRKKVISRTFRRMLESHLRQAFNGPPENTRDRIMAATKALRQADHDRAFKFLSNLRMFDENLMPGGAIVRDFVLSKLKIKLQEDALKTWLLSYAHHYVSISVKELVEQFKLDGSVVRRLASKMMMNEELQGAWDEPTASIVMTSQQLTPLQRNVLGYAEKLNFLVEMNEKMSDPKQPFIPRPDWEKGGDRDRSDRPERAAERQYGGYQDGEQRNSNQNQSQWNAHSNRGYQQRGRRY